MKLNQFFTFLCAACSLFLISCEEEFVPDTDASKQELVLEGYIELGEGANPTYVILTKSIPFVSTLSPLELTYDKEHTNVGYYIDKAGGYGIRPWKKRIYVTYANGKSKRTTSLFFIHFYPKVKEGSTITVPLRPEGAEVTHAVVQVALSSIPIAVAAFIAKIIQ